MINFTKMHGAGNDYIYINCFEENIDQIENLEQFIIEVSDRHFGIGGDGVILICPSTIADAKMIMYNADGSEGKMCGNGIRCVGKYVYDHHICNNNPLYIETKSGVKELNLTIKDDIVKEICVNMGSFSVKAEEIPVLAEDSFINQPIIIDNEIYHGTCVSMGNPHIVVFVNNIDDLDLEKLGPLFENHPLFPERINTEFVEIINPNSIKFRVWERGSGETLACGTGACASVVAGVENKYFQREKEIQVFLKGGILYVTLQNDNSLLMRGPAEEVFNGKVKCKKY